MVFLITLFLFSLLPSSTFSQNANVSCPLDFSVLSPFTQSSTRPAPNSDIITKCNYIRNGLQLVLSNYLQRTNSFLPPPNSSESCWTAYQSPINSFLPTSISENPVATKPSGSHRRTTRLVLRVQLPYPLYKPHLLPVFRLETCLIVLGYPKIYAAAFANIYGPSDIVTSKSGSKKNVVILVVLLVFGVGEDRVMLRELKRVLNLGWIRLVKVPLWATKNFARDSIIGRGGYGNVYKGVLPDGSEVALKRFKNCSAAGDANFTHEVEVIARYCTATTPFEGHQRIIVCDLMKNGSLYDHLFGGLEDRKLSWPIRQKIALGDCKGDIKASNILLDEMFEAKVADFGLAKFTPEGMTHLSTRVAGTMGYVAPEYALYGQLTERSDVYSFGVVLLELLSGRKALSTNGDGQPILVTDWAWSSVRNGRTLDVIDNGMPELAVPEVLEKYVLVAVLCSHPQLYARPTMDQVVKMLETDLSVPSIPARPIPLVAEINDIERSASSSGSGQLSSPTGYQPYTLENGRLSDHMEEGIKSSE
ncbi:hypothetical protein RGQ29_031949 [Quercus rubra]|uniref:non-specific serine/threonine protein kinase n=1 Tax=Quercus rubra TaxID=3512 RepID=A0AAN7DT36_QUERU|nr:hypothetical protein RGQ29_031949 [Quercus rubra]